MRNLLVALALSLASLPAHAKGAVVLVHGAFADGSSWAKVIPLLRAHGVRVVAVQNPLTSLEDDVAATKRAIDDLTGPVVLVGHSWGGTVITEAGADEKVKALVYVAALAPDAGQTSNQVGSGYATSPGLTTIRVGTGGFLYETPEGIRDNFAQDLPTEETEVMAVTQGPIAAKAFDQKVTVAAWKTKPTWYVVAQNDRMIQPDLERKLAETMHARTTELPTSHVPMLSDPEGVAKVILDAVMAR